MMKQNLNAKTLRFTFKLMTESELDAIKDSTPVTRRKILRKFTRTMDEEELEEKHLMKNQVRAKVR